MAQNKSLHRKRGGALPEQVSQAPSRDAFCQHRTIGTPPGQGWRFCCLCSRGQIVCCPQLSTFQAEGDHWCDYYDVFWCVMDPIPERPRIASPYRALLSFLEKWLVLPDINPAYYHALALLLSVLFLYAQTPLQRALIIGVVLLSDWLDGATARRYKRVTRSGYIADVVTDRISEAFIFLAEMEMVLGRVFFLLWMINSVLTFYSVYSNKHRALPLRFCYMLILITQGV